MAHNESLLSQMYPYLVTDGYPDCLTTPTQRQRALGHDLSVALVAPREAHGSEAGVVAPISAAELADAGIALNAAYTQADHNLEAALSAGQITVQQFDHGPAGAPMVAFSGSWLAATTLTAPGLCEKMARLFGGDVVAAVPHREVLLVFASTDIAAMAELIDDEYRRATHPLTTGLFTLDARGPAALS